MQFGNTVRNSQMDLCIMTVFAIVRNCGQMTGHTGIIEEKTENCDLHRRENDMSKKIYITLTGTKHYYGAEFLEPGTCISLFKEPDNEYDKEAIRAELPGLGKIGYVANSAHTVIGESMSAGRMYDRIGKKAEAKVEIVTPRGVICRVGKKWVKK